ncbi:MAG TPA: tetratricopeptide repeat protein [Solirubrobacteraceae bacterium]|nr:tetratricopeptide repeat protein [Solirubrobacteraceae bacterium]
MVGNVTVTLLNGFSASVDGVSVAEGTWRLKKARELVKLLALAPGRRLHREQAMDVLWRDRPPTAAANNLHQAVYVARKALTPEAIEVREEILQLSADVDVDRFEEAARDARRAQTPGAYRAALSIYGGELLPENRYDDWVTDRRDELADLVAELSDELDGLAPTATEGLPSLPVDASSFIGRDRELSELGALLRGTRLLTLAGAGGVGKTRLALELARGIEATHGGGAALVELAAESNARLVPAAVATALDVRALPGQNLVEAIAGFLASRSLLLVIDNCEHLLAATAGLVDTLLRTAPQLTVLATSREPLRVPGEVVFRVPSLDIPDPDQTTDPAELLGYESVRLFVERADAAAPGFALDDHNAADVARICLRLDGLPLALELAAGRLGALGPAAISQRLDDRFRVLRTLSHASPTRQHTLTATLQWSHELLEPDERTLFRRLAIFAGGFTLEAAETVCASDDLDTSAIADVLARLVEKSLVAADQGTSRERRYRLLETVRMYALERLGESDDTPALEDRHARWAHELVRAERTSPRLDCEAANLHAALDTLLRTAPAEALRFCVALLPFWLRRIDLHEAERRFDEVLAAAPERTAARTDALHAAAAIGFRRGSLARAQTYTEENLSVAKEIGDAHAQWRALQLLGECGIAYDAADRAICWLERALALARRQRFAAAEAISAYTLGVVDWLVGDLARAEELVSESLELFRALEGSPERIPSPVNIAEIRMSTPADHRGLRVVFEESLQPFTEISSDAAVSYVLANQSGLVRGRGDLVRSRELLDESAARFAAAGDEAGMAAAFVRRAYLELAEGDLAAARTALRTALDMRRALRDRRGTGLALAGLGLINTIAGDHDCAARHLAEARAIFRRAGDRWGLATTLWRTADLALADGNLDEAEARLREARTILGETGRTRWIAHTLSGLGEVALLRGDVESAAALLADARDRYASRDDGLGVADVEALMRRFDTPAVSALPVR